MEFVDIYLMYYNKIKFFSIFLGFFLFFPSNFPLLDPDPHIECVSGSRRENECGSMRIRIHSPGLRGHIRLAEVAWGRLGSLGAWGLYSYILFYTILFTFLAIPVLNTYLPVVSY